MSVEATKSDRTSWQDFKAFIHAFGYFVVYLKPIWDKVLLRFVISNSKVFIGMCIAMCAGRVVDEGLALGDYGRFRSWLALGFVLTLAGGILTVVNGVMASCVNMHLESQFRFRVFSHLQRHSLRFFDARPIGEHIYRTNDDTFIAGWFVGNYLLYALERFQTLLVSIGVVMQMNSMIGGLALGYLAFFAPASYLSSTAVRRILFTSRERTQQSFATLQENLAGWPLDKMYGTERRNLRTYYAILAAATRLAIRFMNLGAVFVHFIVGSPLGINSAFIPSLARMMFQHLATAVFFGYLVMQGQLSTGDYLFLGGVLMFLVVPVEEMVGALMNMRIQTVPLERMLETLEAVPEIQDRPGARRLENPQGVIEFDNVSFRYGPGLPEVVRGLSFTAAPGTTTAFVGMSGAGKTSVFNLLMRYYDPTGGSVRIDGEDLRNWHLASYRSHAGIVLQESHVFSATVRDNVLMGRPHASAAEVWEALRKVNMDTIVRGLPDGLDTVLTETGGLSMGDRQRLSIARAVLRDPQFLYLDEPTASLDPETAREVARHLETAAQGRTCILIAHNLHLASRADQIIVMDDGAAVQRGTHASLLDEDGLYRRMWESEQRHTCPAAPGGPP